jgi:hypothetical protein
MPALLLHLTAVDRLAAHANTLPPEFSRAISEDLEYARFGAALPELPWFGGLTLGVQAWIGRSEPPHFSRLLKERAPVAFGLKAAELVANGALVGTEAGLAFLTGYFTQLCISRALEPIAARLLSTHRLVGESDAACRQRIEWTWALFYLEELHAGSTMGTAAIRSRLQIRKAGGARGIGRGMYELMRVSSLEALGEAPTKAKVDGWVRGLYLYSLALSSPLGKFKGLPVARATLKELYRSPGVDVWGAVEAGLSRTRGAMSVLGGMIRRGAFSARSRARFLEFLPEGTPAANPIAADEQSSQAQGTVTLTV